jgi:hypothetical protein
MERALGSVRNDHISVSAASRECSAPNPGLKLACEILYCGGKHSSGW